MISVLLPSGLVAVRHNSDGSLDPSFDNAQAGTAVQDLNGVALEADGQIVVVGTVLNTRGMLVAGLNQDGSLNPQFGTASVNPFSVSGDTLTIYAQPGVNTLDISYYNSYVTVTLNGTSQSFFANGLFGPINNLVYRGNGSADQVTVETGGDSFTQSSSYQGGTIVISTETVGPLSDIVISGSITIQVTGTGTISANETVKIPATQPPSTAPPGPAYPTPLLISVGANVLPVSPLQFHPGSDVSVLQNSGQVSVPLWATSITDAGQALHAPGTITFVTHTSNDTFFSELPWINSAQGHVDLYARDRCVRLGQGDGLPDGLEQQHVSLVCLPRQCRTPALAESQHRDGCQWRRRRFADRCFDPDQRDQCPGHEPA